MSNDLQTSPPSNDLAAMLSLPPLVASWLARLRRASTGAMTISDPRLEQYRTLIAKRAESLGRSLEDFDADMSTAAVLAVITPYALAASNEEAANAKMIGYAQAIEGCPHWAVEEACRRWNQNRVPAEYNIHFPPKPAEIRKIADGIVATVQVRKIMLERLASAEVVEAKTVASDPIFAERASEELKALAARLGSTVDPIARMEPIAPASTPHGERVVADLKRRAAERRDDDDLPPPVS
jgi:hypothetical protein